MNKKDGRHVDSDANVEMDEAVLIRNIQKDYEFSIKTQQKFFDIMIGLALEHDNQIDPDEFPTRTKNSYAYKFAQVEEQLAFALPYLWPSFNPVRVVPRTEEDAMESARKVERAVYSMAKYDMRGEQASLPIIRDCLKLGVGYGIIEPYVYEPLDVFNVSVENAEGDIIEESKEVDIGEPISSLSLRYISAGQIVPYPDGAVPNGPCRASTVFFWDFMSEHEFRNLVTDEFLEGLDFDVAKLNDRVIDDIVNKAKNPNFTFVGSTFENIKQLGGLDYSTLTSAEKSAEATIPILKTFRRGEHVWLANGETLIYRQAKRAQTHRCPILKMSSVRDGMTWFPITVAEAMRGPNFQRNVWANLITDLGVWSTRQPLIYEKGAFNDAAPEFGPDAKIGVSGVDDVRKAAMWLQSPGVGADTIAVGDKLDSAADLISGRTDLTQKNFSRGGQHAFSELVSSAKGRELISGAVMESGFMIDFFSQLMIYMQIGMKGYKRIGREYDEDSGNEVTTVVAVTPEDLAHAYELAVSFDRHRFASEFSIQDRIQLYGMMNDGTWDEYEKKRFLLGNDELLHQMSKSKQETDAIAAENRNDERAAMMPSGQSEAAPEAGAMPPSEAGAELGGAPDMNLGGMM